MRPQLLANTISELECRDFDILMYFCSAFDLGAQRRDFSFLIKVLENIDGFRKEHAAELKRLCACLTARPVLLGEVTKTAAMQSGAVYDRHGIPAFNLETFTDALNEVYPARMSKGRQVVEMDGAKLKNARTAAGFSTQKLADRVGVSKETIYFYEKNEMRAQYDTAKDLEGLLKTNLIKKTAPFEIPAKKPVAVEDELQQALMRFFDVYPFKRTGFDFFALDEKNKVVLRRPARNVNGLIDFSDFFKTLLSLISDKRELLAAESKEDLIKVLRECSVS